MGDAKTFILEFPFQADTPTDSGTIYPREELQNAVDVFKESIGAGTALGELNGTESPPRLERCSHFIENICMIGDKVFVEIKPMVGTKGGDIILELLERGIMLQLNPVGYGDQNWTTRIITRYQISCIHVNAITAQFDSDNQDIDDFYDFIVDLENTGGFENNSLKMLNRILRRLRDL